MVNFTKPIVSFVLGGVVSAGIMTAVLAIGSAGPASAVVSARHERHPFLARALHGLIFAKRQLAKGAHDFQGHRAAALKLTNKAIAQVRIAIRIDRH